MMPSKLETPTVDLNELLLECLNNRDGDKAAIIEQLSPDIVNDLQTYLDAERKLHKKYNHEELPSDRIPMLIRGRLFEMCVAESYRLNLFKGREYESSDRKEAEDKWAISTILCKIAVYPEEYGLNELHVNKIPDGVYVGIDKKGDFVVYALAEAKLGGIDQNAIDQLDPKGSRSNIILIIDKINELIENGSEIHPDLQKIKDILGDNKLRIKNNPQDLKMRVIFPIKEENRNIRSSGRHPTYRGDRAGLEQAFYILLRNSNVEEIYSEFTDQEIGSMADILVEKLR